MYHDNAHLYGWRGHEFITVFGLFQEGWKVEKFYGFVGACRFCIV